MVRWTENFTFGDVVSGKLAPTMKYSGGSIMLRDVLPLDGRMHFTKKDYIRIEHCVKILKQNQEHTDGSSNGQ